MAALSVCCSVFVHPSDIAAQETYGSQILEVAIYTSHLGCLSSFRTFFICLTVLR